MIGKQVIPKCNPTKSGGLYLSNFLGPKKDGGCRPVVNLKALKKCGAEEQHFKMEGFHMVMKPGYWLTKFDLKDAFFLVPVDPSSHQKYLQFLWRGVTYQFQCISLPSIWPIMCTLYIHKTNEASSGFSEGESNQINYIP